MPSAPSPSASASSTTPPSSPATSSAGTGSRRSSSSTGTSTTGTAPSTPSRRTPPSSTRACTSTPSTPARGRRARKAPGAATGATVNCPMPAGARDALYEEAFRARILPAIDAFGPDAVVLSAGFDAHAEDPLASVELSTGCYRWMSERILEAADRHAGGRVLSLLEGGYSLEALPECVAAHLECLAGVSTRCMSVRPAPGEVPGRGRRRPPAAFGRRGARRRWRRRRRARRRHPRCRSAGRRREHDQPRGGHPGDAAVPRRVPPLRPRRSGRPQGRHGAPGVGRLDLRQPQSLHRQGEPGGRDQPPLRYPDRGLAGRGDRLLRPARGMDRGRRRRVLDDVLAASASALQRREPRHSRRTWPSRSRS